MHLGLDYKVIKVSPRKVSIIFEKLTCVHSLHDLVNQLATHAQERSPRDSVLSVSHVRGLIFETSRLEHLQDDRSVTAFIHAREAVRIDCDRQRPRLFKHLMRQPAFFPQRLIIKSILVLKSLIYFASF